LAVRSAEASRKIRRLIEDSSGRVESGTGLAEDAGQRVEGVVSAFETIGNVVNDIAAGSNQQANALAEIKTAVYQVSQVPQANTSHSSSLSQTASELGSDSQNLPRLVSRFPV
jgi:methyl-accepting chemotaxis protein